MTIVLDRQMWNMWDLLLYRNIVKEKNNGLAHVDSSVKTKQLNSHCIVFVSASSLLESAMKVPLTL